MSRLLRTARLQSVLLPLLALAWFPQQLRAHCPVFTKDAATSSATAIPLTEPHISQVVYREITEKCSEVWLRFDVPEDFQLYIQIGIPVIDRSGSVRSNGWR